MIDHIGTNPTFANLVPLGTRTIDGHRAIGYAGTAPQLARGFVTNFVVSGDAATWWTPNQLQIWLIDAPGGVLAITAAVLTLAPAILAVVISMEQPKVRFIGLLWEQP